MIAVDTNIRIYAHRGDSPFHEVAAERIESNTSATQKYGSSDLFAESLKRQDHRYGDGCREHGIAKN